MKSVLFPLWFIFFVVTALRYEDRGKLLIRNFRTENVSWKYGIQHEFIGLDEKDFEKLAGLNFEDDNPEDNTVKRIGRSSRGRILKPQLGRLYPKKYPLPKNFDWRSNTRCQSFFDVRYQGDCGACWAVTSAAVMSDRYCLWTNKSRIFSAWDIATCMSENPYLVCSGNTARNAFKHYIYHGVVTGGDPRLGKQYRGCIPYPKNFFSETFMRCPRDCTSGDGRDYDWDKKFGTELKVISGVDAIKMEIYENGPVLAGFKLYSDFLYYKSGVYYNSGTSTYIGGHAVRLIGWGVDNGIPYWIGVNNWGSQWGEKGFFKFLRLGNHCGIEGKVTITMPMEAFE